MKDYFGMKSNYGSVVEQANISLGHDREKSEEKLKTILKCVYDYADALFDDRLGSHIECLDETFRKTEEALNAFKKASEAFGEGYVASDELQKLECLARGNLLLRKGQYLNERFRNASAILRQGSEILIRSWDSNQDTELDMLIRLNIGKYFRDMGKQKQRQYYYDRALEEFRKLTEQLEAEKTNTAAGLVRMEETTAAGKKEFRLHLWMDAKMNVGRLQKDLYQLDDAKRCFLGFIRTLLPLCSLQMRMGGDAGNLYDEGMRLLGLFPDDNADKQEKSDKTQNDEDFTKRLKNTLGEVQYKNSYYGELYSEYLIQALVQLGIVCRKERNYEEAKTIFDYILEIDKGNVDAINNLGVCAYKRGDISAAENYFEQVTKNRDGSCNTNRFAETGLLKCAIQSQKNGVQIPDGSGNATSGSKCELIDVEAKITGILADNPEDYEILFLKGFWLRRNHRYLAAQEIFEELYRKNPDLSNGSIGLKAFYNLALCCMEQGKYSQAETILGRICDENSLDLLARLDQAESQMHRGYYGKAQMNYLAVFIGTEYGFIKAEPWRRAQAMRNYGECCLKIGLNGGRNLAEAERALRDSMKIEPDNTYAPYLLAVVMHEKILELVKSLAEHEPDASDRNQDTIEIYKEEIRVRYLECIERMEAIIEKEPEDIRCYSCLVIWSVEYLEMCGWENPWFEKKVGHCLKYVQNSYSLKACVSLVDFIEHRQSGNPDEELYRYLSGITIGKKEEGYAAFQNLTDSRFFQIQDDVTKGRILACLFQLYDEIIGIKDMCRYSLGEKVGRKKKTIVHYTKMSTLKILLADAKDKKPKLEKSPEEKEDQPRLRLWNTFYMNDPMEGRLFFELMDDLGDGNGCEKTDHHILEKYYYVEDKPFHSSKEQPNNSNVYITSMSSDKDSLMMWITYSNNADGCAIEFGDDFFDIRYDPGIEMGTSLYTDEDYPLYTVKYIDRKKFSEIARGCQTSNSQNSIEVKERNAEENELETICRRMIRLRESLRQLDEYLNARTTRLNNEMEQLRQERSRQQPQLPEQKRTADKESDKKLQQKKYDMRQWKVCQESVRKFVADSLNGIRFLFKNTEYRHEKEIRAVRYETKAKVDWTSFEVPRLYVDVDRDIYMNEVQLGPRVDPVEADRISAWLQTTEKVHSVVRSERHYR
ncbi:MAG: tetratricopeptide repeat protein [Clostridiales bacterium]|nr:tetratricopeptide repeat protein [Clostridiales bacterium]